MQRMEPTIMKRNAPVIAQKYCKGRKIYVQKTNIGIQREEKSTYYNKHDFISSDRRETTEQAEHDTRTRTCKNVP